MAKPRHIAINLPFTPIAREIMRGIRSYFDAGANLTFETRTHQDETARKWLANECDGVITYAGTPAWHEFLHQLGLPCAVVHPSLIDMPVPCVAADSLALGRLAADYLLARRFEAFGVVSIIEAGQGQLRAEGFIRVIQEAGHKIFQYGAAQHSVDALREWVSGLPRPIGLFAATDSLGTQVLTACRQLEAAVPDEVAVIAVGNDVQVCNLCTPPLSSIVIPFDAMGREAAKLVYTQMEARVVPRRIVLIPPSGVVTRKSSETTVVSDPIVAQAARYIAEHACDPIGVEDVARYVGYSYRWLHERFRLATGRLLHDEIRRVQLNRAKILLSETNMPIYKVAEACGWGSGKQIDRIFKQFESMTPTEYRARHGTN